MVSDVLTAPFVPNPASYALNRTLHWALRTARTCLTGGRSDYVAVSPPFLTRQVIRDRKTGRRMTFRIRDESDYCTLENTFLEENYRLLRLARAPEIASAYERILARGQAPLIVDCGANIGLTAAYFSAKFPRAKIIAIEPNEANLRLARLNCPSPQVEFVQAGIASECKKGRIVDPGRGNDAFRVDPDPLGSLDLISVDSLLERQDGAEVRPFIIKIDIEGFEHELFSQNTAWIERFPLLIIELHDWLLPKRGTSANFLRAIAALDRDFVYIAENVFSLSNRAS
ncbi:MAG: FkbM family methyltransferase [Alphaproteobacteria bacterium]|nr:FkbM family methyltransferase [Alphaproteobacteria bacterium]